MVEGPCPVESLSICRNWTRSNHWRMSVDNLEVCEPHSKILWCVYPLIGNNLVNTFLCEPACKKMTSIARQRISKHASVSIEAVFSIWAMQSGYKEVFGSSKHNSQEMKIWVSRSQPTRIWAWNWIESSLRNGQLQNNSKKGSKLWKQDFMCDLKLQCDL
jgi:hypothetical protein